MNMKWIPASGRTGFLAGVMVLLVACGGEDKTAGEEEAFEGSTADANTNDNASTNDNSNDSTTVVDDTADDENQAPDNPEQLYLQGEIAGLNGSVSLSINGTTSLSYNTDGFYTFSDEIAQGREFDVVITEQPALQYCAVTPSSGVFQVDMQISIECQDLYFFTGGGVESQPDQKTFALWATAGTPESTYRVADECENCSFIGMPFRYARFGDDIYFNGSDGNPYANPGLMGYELWKSDGSEEGTVLAENLSSEFSGHPDHMTVVGDKLVFFAAQDRLSESPMTGLMTYDSNANLRFIANGLVGDQPIIVDGQMVFNFWTLESSHYSVYSTDGISVSLLHDDAHLHGMTGIGTALYGFKVLKGTVSDLMCMPDINEPADGMRAIARTRLQNFAFSFGDSTDQATEYQGELFYVARNTDGVGIWRADCATGEVTLVAQPRLSDDYGIFGLQVINGSLYFVVEEDSIDTRSEPDIAGVWKTDGTPAGTSRVAAVNTRVSVYWPSLSWSTPVVVNGRYYFAGYDEVAGFEVWSYDTITETAARVSDVSPGRNWSSPTEFVARGDHVMFIARRSQLDGYEWWRTDGTDEGTFLLKDTCPVDFCDGATNTAQ